MTTLHIPTTASPPSPKEVANFVRLLRENLHWSQEQLAAISGLSARTIQRVEQGESANFDTRRALARAFELEDIDALNKPLSVPSEEEFRAAKEKYDRDNIMLGVEPLTSGRQLAQLAETHEMDLAEPAFELRRDAAEVFTALVDAFHDYRECSELYTAVQKLDFYDDFQRHIDELKAKSVSLRYAERRMQMGINTPDSKSLRVTVLYFLAFPLGKEPEQIATPRDARISW